MPGSGLTVVRTASPAEPRNRGSRRLERGGSDWAATQGLGDPDTEVSTGDLSADTIGHRRAAWRRRANKGKCQE